jgi:RimJ/RimL family protein N-acetyltransferase
MSALGPTLQTPRLRMEPPRNAHFDAFAAMMADPRVMAMLGGAQSRPVAWRTFAAYAGAWALDGFGMFMVFEKATGAFVGRVGPLSPEGWPGTEVGWGLTHAAQGRGLATEAAAAAMDFAFDRLGWDEVIHCIVPENAPSHAVARRLGSRELRAGRLPDPINIPTVVWGQSRAEWRENRRRRGLATD